MLLVSAKEHLLSCLRVLYALRVVATVGQSFATLHSRNSLLASRRTLLTMALLKIGMSLEGIGYNHCWHQSFSIPAGRQQGFQ